MTADEREDLLMHLCKVEVGHGGDLATGYDIASHRGRLGLELGSRGLTGQRCRDRRAGWQSCNANTFIKKTTIHILGKFSLSFCHYFQNWNSLRLYDFPKCIKCEIVSLDLLILHLFSSGHDREESKSSAKGVDFSRSPIIHSTSICNYLTYVWTNSLAQIYNGSAANSTSRLSPVL